MKDDPESALRQALRPVAPTEGFEERLLARVTAERSSPPKPSRLKWRRSPATRWLSASLAASILAAVGIQHHLHAQREREIGLEARRQVMEALRVTDEKLDLAYRIVKGQSSSVSDDESGV
jgi:hypothetical protein